MESGIWREREGEARKEGEFNYIIGHFREGGENSPEESRAAGGVYGGIDSNVGVAARGGFRGL